MYLKKLEKSLERIIEGRFIGAINDRIHPMEVAKRLSQRMRDEKLQILDRQYVPNVYLIHLSHADYKKFEGLSGTLQNELIQFLTMEVQDLDLRLIGEPAILIKESDNLNDGDIHINCLFTSITPGQKTEEDLIRNAAKGVLAIKEGFGKGEMYLLKGESFSIGRSEQNDIVISDPKVSGDHCKIEWSGKNIIIKDLESRNGIIVNKKSVIEAELADKDEILLGFTTMQFRRLIK